MQILAELVSAKFFVCRGFCLMPTHYHLLAWFDDEMLSGAIHRLNRRYAGGFNRRHSRRGHVFDSPFTAVFVEDDVHFRWLDEYIANNPSERPSPWSSYDSHFSFVVTREPGSKNEPGS